MTNATFDLIIKNHYFQSIRNVQDRSPSINN